ncbi:hypothetical protein Kpol_2001p52 [Vanderwaltozyma polyspora DSM 70294]|uniref:Ribosomal RNA-processing protein 43 n=1 Tax=Vanderwaltozyma polyspora (strain ATCC 22028 / DSM 70294 / BCRC 21397 / CBS 2163 / NBRC 10782 / NRRL Y-8283 / UCD 57-17) TaxID=436907 RepID=A7TGT4_VANPO|nr:uncharacterized protein Kpol_2001p52 [Vanderwaltozyma polyspora DSM 70294]EDO18547.1 hypothetical protein Kpol_2001p52 [Vanderwaltozyma polyspora DSM 70294]
MTDFETVDVSQVSFPPEILAKISPELSLQRHLSLGLRPSLRAFEEFRDVTISEDKISHFSGFEGVSESNDILGFNVLKSGKTIVTTTITGGIVENMVPIESDDIGEQELLELTKARDELNQYVAVFPNVTIEKGRKNIPPTQEEITLSQRLHDNVLHSGIIPKKSLKVKCGLRSIDSEGNINIVYPDELDDNDIVKDTFKQISDKRSWSYVLYAKIVVFGRTGPLLPLCWNSLICALKSTRLPRVFLDERAARLKMTVRTRGKSLTVKEAHDLICDPNNSLPLEMHSYGVGFASNFGIIDIDPEAQIGDEDDDDQEMVTKQPISVLLADIDTEAEEENVRSVITVISDSEGNLKNLNLVGGGSKLTLDMIKKSIKSSKSRSKDLSSKFGMNK